MPRLGITPKQRKYAYNIMNTETTKKQAVLDSGYSESMARNPIKIENSAGFKLAMAGIFAQSGNVSMAILNEMDAQIQAGKLKELELGKLVNYFDVMTRAMERIAPKETTSTSDDMNKIFAGIVGGETGETTGETLDNEITEQSRDTMQDLTSIIKDSIVSDNDSQVLQHETSDVSSEPLTDSPASGIE